MEQVDARGLSCPEPAMMAREALIRGESDEVEVLVDSATSRDNVLRVGRQLGWEGSAEDRGGGNYALIFRRRSA